MKALAVISWIAAFGLLAQTSNAESLDMTKIVVRYTGPAIKPDSFAAQPKTVYRVAEKYTRIEEPMDPQTKTETLIITKEPDSWKINLANKTAQHMVDPGPTFNSRVPILWWPKAPGEPDPEKVLSTLEFGNEVRFFRDEEAHDAGMRDVEGKECKASSMKVGSHEIVLLMDPISDKPVQIDVTNDGKPQFSVHYVTYETGLPFDPSLFEVPQGVTITESKSESPKAASSAPSANPSPTSRP